MQYTKQGVSGCTYADCAHGNRKTNKHEEEDGNTEPKTETDANRQHATYQVMETTPRPLSPKDRLHVPRSSQFYAPFATCFPPTKVICNLEMQTA